MESVTQSQMAWVQILPRSLLASWALASYLTSLCLCSASHKIQLQSPCEDEAPVEGSAQHLAGGRGCR